MVSFFSVGLGLLVLLLSVKGVFFLIKVIFAIKIFNSLTWRTRFKIGMEITTAFHADETDGWVYHFRVTETRRGVSLVKIGCSDDVAGRIRYWQGHYARSRIENMSWVRVNYIRRTERILHIIHEDTRVRRRCFNHRCSAKHTELFALSKASETQLDDLSVLIDDILSLCYGRD
ncbi:hypothetical protein VNI00_009267 [Paramarasmius palmivorus]|uniref:Bacteriophage T5 Orf172 DNA-binding domain-containing protein n=1 Tax=Paramarasmius palmivorus TaxID=297713 RepID=A0AAW0CTH1_9AGAR